MKDLQTWPLFRLSLAGLMGRGSCWLLLPGALLFVWIAPLLTPWEENPQILQPARAQAAATRVRRGSKTLGNAFMGTLLVRGLDGCSRCSQNPSIRPAATQQRSIAAEPSRRIARALATNAEKRPITSSSVA